MSVMSKDNMGAAQANQADAMKIWDIPGGIHPAERKELSNRTPLQQAPG
jgi:electron transport complex protein RnfC